MPTFTARRIGLIVAAVTSIACWFFIFSGDTPKKHADPVEFFEKCRSTPEHMKNLDAFMRIVGDALEEHNITYWLDSGTLLGAYRFHAYNSFEDDLDVIVEVEEFIEKTHQFRKSIDKKVGAIGLKTRYAACDGEASRKSYDRLICQIWMVSPTDGYQPGDPQIDLLPMKYVKKKDRFELLARFFRGQTPNGFPTSLIFGDAYPTKFKTKYGTLGSLSILGRTYPAPVNVEGYCGNWYKPTNFMRDIVMRQMKPNKLYKEFCADYVSRIFAIRQEPLAHRMVQRNKDIFGETFDAENCPLCVLLKDG